MNGNGVASAEYFFYPHMTALVPAGLRRSGHPQTSIIINYPLVFTAISGNLWGETQIFKIIFKGVA